MLIATTKDLEYSWKRFEIIFGKGNFEYKIMENGDYFLYKDDEIIYASPNENEFIGFLHGMVLGACNPNWVDQDNIIFKLRADFEERNASI